MVVSKSLTHDRCLELFERLAVTAHGDDISVDVEEGLIIEVEGPSDLPEHCESFQEVLDVYPSSEMTLI